MVQGNYKIRVKQGDVEIEVEGDKGFVIQTYTDARSMIWKEPVKKAEKPLAAVSVEKKTIPTIEPVKAEPKKRGRKPSKAVEKVKEPVVKAEPKKRGRKPSKAVKKVKEPVVKAEPKKRGRKPSKAVKKVKEPAVKAEKPTKKAKVDLKGKDLGYLMKVKDPKNDAFKVVLAGYHINKNERKREFRSVDIEDVLKKFNVEAPNNVSYYLRKLSDDKGLLTHGRKSGRYKISDSGVKWVEYN